MRYGIALALLACALFSVARAQAVSVVLVPTQGSKSWKTAESRIVAELRASGIDIIVLGPREAGDKKLSVYAQRHGSAAAVQIQRKRQLGAVRLWLRDPSQRSGEFRHVAVDLRGANVVSQAVLPSVEVVFAHVEWFQELTRLEKEDDSFKHGREDGGPATAALPAQRRRTRAESRWIPRLGTGPWFSGDGTSPGVSLTLGAQMRLTPVLYWSAEVSTQPIPHEVTTDLGDVTVLLAGARGFLIFEPWSHADVSAGVGAGGGIALARSNLRGTNPDYGATALLSGRVQLATPIASDFDVTLVMTANWGLPGLTVRRSDVRPRAGLLRPGIDAMLALDWLWL